MAVTRTRSVTRTKAIPQVRRRKQDIYSLAREYGRMPITRFILGGVAISLLAPYVARFFRNPEVQEFVRDNVEGIRSRIDEVINTAEDRLESNV